MSIKIRTGAALRSLVGGQAEVEVEAAAVGEALDKLGIRDRICDDTGKVRRHFNIHVNESEDIRLGDGLDTPLKDGDEVTILSAIAGGSGAVSKKVWLTFPPDKIEKPVIWEVGRRYDVVTNIRQASVSKEIGIVGLEITGEESEVAKALDHFTAAGVSVEPIELGVIE